MPKKKGGKKGGKKGKKGGDGAAKIIVETTKEMEKERAMLRSTGLPLGSRFSMKRRAEAIRGEVASARLKTCMLKQTDVLSLRGLSLEETPPEFGWGVPPFEKMWLGLRDLDLSNNSLFKTTETFDAIACLGNHLVKLDISNNALAGEIPPSAGALVALQHLKASQNQIAMIHPDAAAGWGSITTLNINRNALSGVPLSASAWTRLRSVDMRCNALTVLEDEACASWTLVEVAKLGMNKLAALPNAVGGFVNLRTLYVTDNKIAELPLGLANCRKLEVLHCGVNVVKDLPPELFGSGALAAMKDLELYRNKIGSFPEEFGGDMPLLEQLSLSGNAIKAVPGGLARCPLLREIHCANNTKLTKIPEELGQLENLAYVSLAGCAALKSLPSSLATAWPALREIDVRSGAKKEKCKLSAEWMEASAMRGFILRGGIPPKKGKGKKK